MPIGMLAALASAMSLSAIEPSTGMTMIASTPWAMQFLTCSKLLVGVFVGVDLDDLMALGLQGLDDRLVAGHPELRLEVLEREAHLEAGGWCP